MAAAAPPDPIPPTELAVQNPLTHKPPADRADLSGPPSPPARFDVSEIAEAGVPVVSRVPAPARRSPEPDRAAAPERVAAGSVDELDLHSTPIAPQPAAAAAEPGFFDEIRRFVAPEISEAAARHLAPPMARAAMIAEPDRAVTPDRFTAPRIVEAGPRPVPQAPLPVVAPGQPARAASPERFSAPRIAEAGPHRVAAAARAAATVAEPVPPPVPEHGAPPPVLNDTPQTVADTTRSSSLARPDHQMVADLPAAAAPRPVARRPAPAPVAPISDMPARGGGAAQPPDMAGWLLDRAERYAVEVRERAPEQLDPIEQLLADAGDTARVNMVLSAAEIDNIRTQIRGNWLLPPGIQEKRDLSGLLVTLRLQLRPDGHVTRVTVVDRARMDTDPLFRAMAESTVRAVRRTRRIQELAPEKYLLWRDMRINFDPRELAPRDLGEGTPGGSPLTVIVS